VVVRAGGRDNVWLASVVRPQLAERDCAGVSSPETRRGARFPAAEAAQGGGRAL